MRSSRLAILAVTVGSGLLGWSTVGVTSIAGNLSQATTSTPAPVERHEHDRGRGFDDVDLPRGHRGGEHRGV
jgi:hypothetical protein